MIRALYVAIAALALLSINYTDPSLGNLLRVGLVAFLMVEAVHILRA